ncbi:MAG: InlB B-repeat-containing protein [Clostridia bacterium]|nr:InlB B-repeat-containing protein [Clostridia bacterium]
MKKAVGFLQLLLVFMLVLGITGQMTAGANEPPVLSIKAYIDSVEITSCVPGDFVDVEISVSDSVEAVSTIAIPIHFNPAVVEVWNTTYTAKVADGVKTSAEVADGSAGILAGNIFDKTMDPDYIYWAGDMLYNSRYLYVDNTNGLVKITAYNYTANDISGTQIIVTIRFKAIATGDADIRFATSEDMHYDHAAPDGPRFFNAAASPMTYVQSVSSLTVEQYSVTFESNGGSTIASLDVKPGNLVPEPDDPVKEGYEFLGWYKEDNTDSIWVFDTDVMPSANLTLYAQWNAIDYTVTYDGNTNTGGSPPTDGNTYNITNMVSVLGNTGSLYKTDHTFGGWNTAADGSGDDFSEDDTFAMGSSDVILYAKWINDLQNIQSDTYSIDSSNGVLSQVSLGTSAEQFKLKLQNDPSNIKIYDKQNNEYTGNSLATGMIVRLIINDIVADELVISVLGDVSGDGIIDITDILYIRAIILDTYTMNSYEEPAADINLDTYIDITDILYVRAHILGTYSIQAK